MLQEFLPNLARPFRGSGKLEHYPYLIGGDPSHTNTVARTPYHDSHTWYPVLYRRWGLTELLGMLPTDAVARTANAAYRRAIDPSGGRNCGLYTWIRHWAYQEAREGRYAQLTLAHIRQTTDRRNQTFEDPLPVGEIRSISTSVHKFMEAQWWGNRTTTPNQGSARSQIHSSRRDQLTTAQARERIQAAQAQGAQTRREATRNAITQAVGQLVGSGQRVTRQALQQLTGLDPKTLSNHADIWKR